jgi:hypothetical protein
MKPNLSIMTASNGFSSVWGERGFVPNLVESRPGFRCYEIEIHHGGDISLGAIFRIKIEKSRAGYFDFSGLLRWPAIEIMRDELNPPHVQSKMLYGRFPVCMIVAVQPFDLAGPISFGEICFSDVVDIFKKNRDSFLSLAASAESMCTISGLLGHLSAPDWSRKFHIMPWVVGLIFAATGRSEEFAAWEHQHVSSINPSGNKFVRDELAAKLRQLLDDVNHGRRKRIAESIK